MRIYIDCEFLEDGRSIDLISIGMVADDGREYYAIEDDPWTIQRAVEHPWLAVNVIPSLPLTVREHAGGMRTATSRDGRLVEFANRWDWDKDHPDFGHVKPRRQIALDVLRFIRATPGPQLYGWYSAYDHVALAQLFGRMADLPDGIPMFTGDLEQECVRLGNPRVPQQETGQHNALEDARHNRVIAEFLDRIGT